jgi:cell division septation protein DedD
VKPTTNINRRSAFVAIAATLLVSVFTPLVYNSWTDSKNRASEQARVDLGISKTVTDVFHKEERTTVPPSTDTKPAVVETIDPAHHQPVSPAEELSIKVSELPETKNTEHDTNSVAEKLVRRPIEKMSNRATNGRHAYTFVLGSFKDKLNAEKTIRRIKNDGYAPTVKLQDSLYRVSVSIFCSQLEMNNYLKQFQRDYHPQVWVVR